TACLEDASDRHFELKAMLAERQLSYAQAATELQELVRFFGSDPEESGSMSGALHRGWVNVKTAIVGKADEAVLAECNHGEESAVRAYRKVLAYDLPIDIRMIIEGQLQNAIDSIALIKTLHEELKVSA
ncbi:MAG: PA2169 family four-helix-bundle protein, partial [Pseudomonadota bacterium]